MRIKFKPDAIISAEQFSWAADNWLLVTGVVKYGYIPDYRYDCHYINSRRGGYAMVSKSDWVITYFDGTMDVFSDTQFKELFEIV